MAQKQIPTYSIKSFKNTADHRDCQVEIFNRNRNFKVSYPHRHDFYELLYITRGTGEYTIDFKSYEIKANTLFFVSPGQIHNITYSDDTEGYIYLFTEHFYLLNKQNKSELSELPFFNNLTGDNPPLLIQPDNLEFINNLFITACGEQMLNDGDSNEMMRAILDIILIFCKRNYPYKIQEKTGKGKELIKRLTGLLEQNYLKNYSVQEYAGMLHITANHLNETIKNHLGITASQLIDDKLVLEIKRMLIHTDLNINEIAVKFNFDDQSYFSRFFKKRTGSNPTEFRANAIINT